MNRCDEIPQGLVFAGLAHDLNNVFQTLLGVAAQLEEFPEGAALSSAILRSVERGQNIIACLQNPAEFAPCDIILANAVSFLDDYRAVNGDPPVAVRTVIDRGIELRGHWDWERVFINLFLNSARAMPRGGTIRVEGRLRENGLEITVADEGAGIPEDILGHLFEPHVSASGSSGIGLSIVQSIVDKNGGRVHGANRPDHLGAEFRIWLPFSSVGHANGVASTVTAGR